MILRSCLLLRTEYLNICNNPTMPLNSTINELEIFNNGNLTYENRTGYKYSWPPDKYCINSSNTEESVSLLLQDTNEKTIIYICLNATGIPHTDDDVSSFNYASNAGDQKSELTLNLLFDFI